MIDLDGKSCVGCGVCTLVCPVKYLTLSENEIGEFRPSVVEGKCCVKCDMCNKKCVAEHNDIPNFDIIQSYYGYAKDCSIQDSSSSGGVFYAVAKSFIESGGAVCGASFDEDGLVKHILVNRSEELYRIQGSKYCESFLPDVLSKIEELLRNGNKVLFSGVPCNIAALKKYLGIEYNNLYTCEVFCHGTPRRGVYRRYRKNLENKYGRINSFNFRSKEKGWSHPGYKIETDRGDIYQSHSKNIYHLMFGMHHSLRRSCLNCKFRSIRRHADLSLGDFWGIDDFYPNVHRKDHGISAVLVNTNKGKSLLDQSDLILFNCKAEEVFKANKWQITNFDFPVGYEQFNEDYIKYKDRTFFKKYQVKYLILNRLKRVFLKR